MNIDLTAAAWGRELGGAVSNPILRKLIILSFWKGADNIFQGKRALALSKSCKRTVVYSESPVCRCCRR